MSGISFDDDDSQQGADDDEGEGEELEPWEAVFYATATVLADMALEKQLAVVTALRDPEPDARKLGPEVRKVFEEIAEELFEEDDEG